MTCVANTMASTGWESEFRSNRLMTTIERVKEAREGKESGESVSLSEDPFLSVNLENDLMGVRIWGPPTQPTLSIGHADVWDRRVFNRQDKVFTMAEIRELAAKGEIDRVKFNDGKGYGTLAHNRYDFPVSKPVGQLILGTPFGKMTQVTKHDFGHATITVEGDGKRLVADVIIFPDRSALSIKVRQEGLEAGDFWVRCYRHRDTITPGTPVCPTLGGRPSGEDFEQLPMPTAFSKEEIVGGIQQSFFPDPTFPEGFQAVLAATVDSATVPSLSSMNVQEGVVGLGTRMIAEGDKEGRISHMEIKRYTPINEALGSAVTLRFKALPPHLTVYASVATTQNLSKSGESVEDSAAQTLVALSKESPEEVSNHIQDVYQQSIRQNPARALVDGHVVFEAPRYFLRNLRKPDGYYMDLPLASVGSTKFQFQDQGIWKHGITFNEIMAEPMATMGMLPELKTYVDYVSRMLPAAREHAKNIFGLEGAQFPLNDYPLRVEGGFVNTNQVWDKDMGLNGLITKPLWLYYRMTGDKDVLRSEIYPVLKEASRFMAAYATPNDKGKLEIVPTVAPEHWGLTNNFERNRNATSALTLTRYLWNATAAAATELGVDLEFAEELRAKAEALVPFPTTTLPSGDKIWVDVEGASNSGEQGREEYNIAIPMTPVFWGDEVGLDSERRTLDMAFRTLKNIKVWKPHQFYLHIARARLGAPQAGDLLTPESFLLSYQSIQLFPGIPAGHAAEMQHLHAQGGFLISAKRDQHGVVSDFSLLSTRGGEAVVRNPWPGSEVAVMDVDGNPVQVQSSGNGIFKFPTAAKMSYTISNN